MWDGCKSANPTFIINKMKTCKKCGREYNNYLDMMECDCENSEVEDGG